jgi:hypothetical protein
LREDWIKTNTVAPSSDDDGGGGFVEPVDDVLGTYHAESLVGEMV